MSEDYRNIKIKCYNLYFLFFYKILHYFRTFLLHLPYFMFQHIFLHVI